MHKTNLPGREERRKPGESLALASRQVVTFKPNEGVRDKKSEGEIVTFGLGYSGLDFS